MATAGTRPPVDVDPTPDLPQPAPAGLKIGPIATLRDQWLLHSMLTHVGDLPENVYLPVLRLVADDRDEIEAGWAGLVSRRRRGPLFEMPRHSWERQYGQFVRECEWVTTELLKSLPWAAVQELVSDTIAARLREWLRLLLPVFGAVRFVPKSWYAPVMDWGVSLSTFLVGPVYRVGEEPDGTLVYEIPACAMHTVVGTGRAQENSCQMGCKAACEKVFSADSSMPLEFDPHLPGLGCTLRVRKAH